MCKELIAELLNKLVDNKEFVSYLESKNLILKRTQSLKIPVLKINFISLYKALNEINWNNGIYFVGEGKYFSNIDVNSFEFSFIPDDYIIRDKTTKNTLINKGIGFVDENLKVFKPKAIFNGKAIHLADIYALLVCILNEKENINLAISYLWNNHYITDIEISAMGEDSYTLYSISRNKEQVSQFAFNNEGKGLFVRSFAEKCIEQPKFN